MIDRARTARKLAPFVILAALAVGFLWRTTLGGRAMLPGDLLLLMDPWRHYARQFPEFSRVSNPILDAVQQFYPWRKYAGESLRKGLIPLWNPYELCGNPFVGNNQSAVFYPETWLHALMPAERALGWATALYFLLAGSLAYWFLRVVELRRPAALFGAVAFMFNGFIVGWLCFPSFRSVPGWLPGMLAGFEICLRSKRPGWLAVSALCAGMQFLAGNLHISLIVLTVFGAYVVVRCVATWVRGDRRTAVVAASGAVGALLLGLALGAAQLLPALELARMSSRAGGITYAGVLKHAIAPPYLLAALMPDIFGDPVDYNHWGAELGQTYRAYTETAWYIGVAPVLLAPAAFWRRRRSQAWFWAAMLVVGLALAMGTPLYALVYYLLPGAKALSGIGRSILISSTGLAFLGALGLDALLERAEGEAAGAVSRYAWRAGLAVGVVGLVGGMWVWMMTGALEKEWPGIGSYTWLQVGRFALFCVLTAVLAALLPWRRQLAVGALVALLALDLYWFVDKFTPATRPEYLHVQAQSVERIRQDAGWPRILSVGDTFLHRMAANTPMIVGLEDIQGSDSLEIGAYRRLIGPCFSEELGFPQPDPRSPLIDLLGAKYLISGIDLGDVPGFSLLSTYDSWLYLNEEALPRAFTVPECEVRATYGDVLREVTAPDFTPGARAVFAGPDRPSQPPGPRPVGDVRVPVHGADLVVVEGEFAGGEILVLADTYYPGWRAYQDARECGILRADCALRAVEIDRPCREVCFVYQPASFTLGAFASLVAVGLLTAIGAYFLTARRNPRTP